MEKIHINIDGKLKKEVKVKAAREVVSITEVVINFLKQWVGEGKR